MEDKGIELRSAKVRHVIGKMPRRLVFSAICIYLIVLVLIVVIVCLLDIESGGILNRLLGK